MATYGNQITRSFKASMNYSACGQYCFVKAGSAAGEVTVLTSNNGSILGVLQNDPMAGEEALVCLYGTTKVWTETEDGGSPIALHGLVKSASSGKAIGAPALWTGSPPNIGGIAFEAVASGSGAYVEIFLRPQIGTWNV